MALIPAWYIPIKTIDYEQEALQFLGASRSFGRLTLPAPFGCYFTLLELITSKFFTDPGTCAGIDISKALVILTTGRASIDLIAASLAGKNDLDKTALRYWKKHGPDIAAHYESIVEWVLVTPCEGFDMLPTGPKSNKPFWFDAEYLASHTLSVSRASGLDIDAIMWHLPFAALGHLIAADAKREGVKGVERKPNREVLAKEQLAASEREKRGELHPWQRRYPDRYPPTRDQVDARLEIVNEWEEIRKNPEKPPHAD